ncbi:MAG: CopG family transcriptional regulator [Candidatus Omnitrophica bacterium]|nr:CopG family transcriptional regulator [Candidatus Omnitrophota bacterium]MDE2010342.1 CopG family transcriptional regulator [Candidatus Omnitrophota bacterium]MDE2215429.1 CopG family transcriptional regulator [Candidatus Omnitrophota bacterium]MDE2232255.1 CopG family transcriptional regulator [Candidatus Omnitrophota bacterium]
MASLTKRATIYFDPAIHRVLKVKSAETEQSISEIIDETLRHGLSEDEEDLAVFSKRAKEPTVSYEGLLKKLKADGKI